MKPRFILAALLACVMTMSLGCATSAPGKAYARRTAFNVALNDVTIVRQAGKINDETYAGIVGAAELTTPFMDELDRAAVLGIAPDFEVAYINAGIRLHDFLLRAALGVPQSPGSEPVLPPPEPTTAPVVDHPAILGAQKETQRLMQLARSLL